MSLRNERKEIEDRHLQWSCSGASSCSQSHVSKGLAATQKQLDRPSELFLRNNSSMVKLNDQKTYIEREYMLPRAESAYLLEK